MIFAISNVQYITEYYKLYIFFQPINKIFDFYFFFQTLEITKEEEEEEEEEEVEDAINFALQLYYTIFETHARSFIRSKANRLGIA